jgi:TPR repeat protein
LALAWEYARGDVIQVDIANAWYWFERAAGSGQDVAVVNWARFLQLRGVPEGVRALHADRLNQLRAVVWYDPVI